MSRRILGTLALVVSILATFVTGMAGVSAQSEDTGLGEGVYLDPGFGFSVSWDPDSYDAEEIVSDEDVVFGVSLSGDGIFGEIFAGGYSSTRNCLTTLTENLEGIDGVSGFAEADDLDLLETDPDARAAMYRYDYENPDTGDSSSWVRYFDCRDLIFEGEPAEDAILAVSVDFAETEYDTVVADWEAILASIEFDASGGSGDNGNGATTDGPIAEGAYTDPSFNYAVSWDPDAYEATEIVSQDDVVYGVSLSATGVFAEVFNGEYTSTRRCVSTLADNLGEIEGVSNLTESEELDLPETDPDARAALYTYDYENPESGEATSWVHYYECREMIFEGEPVEDIFLIVSVDITDTEYDSTVRDLEDLLATIEFDASDGSTNGGDNGNGGSTDLEPGVNGNVYLDPTNGYSVTWNERDLTGENWDPSDTGDTEGLQLVAETGAFLTVFVQEDTSVRSCANGRADAIAGDSFGSFEEVDLDLPESGDDARQVTWQGIFTNSEGDEIDIILYGECRPLMVDGAEVEDMFLAVDGIAGVGEYEDVLPAWSEALTSVVFDAASGGGGNQPTDDPTEEATDEPTEEATDEASDESGIAGNTYTSSLGYSISWDDSVYTAELTDEEEPDLGISISSENSFMLVQVAGDPSLEACVEAEADVVGGLEGISDFSPSRLDGPEPGRGVESGSYGATLTFESGNEEPVFVYIQCTELGEAEGATLAVIVRMTGLESTYEDELPLWQEIIDSLEITGPE